MRNALVDPETLAALLDGTLSHHDRAAALVRLVKSDPEYDELIETAALLSELSPPSGDPGEPPSFVALVREDSHPLASPTR